MTGRPITSPPESAPTGIQPWTVVVLAVGFGTILISVVGWWVFSLLLQHYRVTPIYGREDSTIMVVVAEEFTIELPAGTSVGNQWSVVSNSNSAVVVLIGERDGSSDGSGRTHLFDFRPEDVGTSTIEISNCFRCSDDAPGSDPERVETLVFEITVAPAGLPSGHGR